MVLMCLRAIRYWSIGVGSPATDFNHVDCMAMRVMFSSGGWNSMTSVGQAWGGCTDSLGALGCRDMWSECQPDSREISFASLVR